MNNHLLIANQLKFKIFQLLRNKNIPRANICAQIYFGHLLLNLNQNIINDEYLILSILNEILPNINYQLIANLNKICIDLFKINDQISESYQPLNDSYYE